MCLFVCVWGVSWLSFLKHGYNEYNSNIVLDNTIEIFFNLESYLENIYIYVQICSVWLQLRYIKTQRNIIASYWKWCLKCYTNFKKNMHQENCNLSKSTTEENNMKNNTRVSDAITTLVGYKKQTIRFHC